MLIGRDSELSQVEKVLRAHKHALVVVSSRPKMGRSTFLEEIRHLAASQDWLVLPSPRPGSDASLGTITIDRSTNRSDFLTAISNPLPAGTGLDVQPTSASISSLGPKGVTTSGKAMGVSPVAAAAQVGDISPPGNQNYAPSTESVATSVSARSQTRAGSASATRTLILISSYQPDKEFESWFLDGYLPDARRAPSPVMLVVAGYASDLTALTEKSDLRIDLGDLPINLTDEYFRNLNAEIQAKMDETEIRAYADASSKAPALIDTLARLLRHS